MPECSCNIFPASLGNVTFGAKVGIGIDPAVEPGVQLDLSQNLRIGSAGRITPASGKGLELFYYAAADGFYLEAYDYGVSAYKPLRIQGSPVVFAAGNVGIGVVDPGQRLEVAGNIKLVGQWDIIGGSGTGEDLDLKIGNDGGNVIIRDTADNILFRQFNNGQLVLGYRGNVGIGTTDPRAKLDVAGVINTTLIEFGGSARYMYWDSAQLRINAGIAMNLILQVSSPRRR
ncbi:MAG: hypothetical protein M1136_01900 [Chloroflexi bacterium]|nr:hypothetical protein [Chloroflexota bacterium]MCL5074393.1 hypothetical protein [Chloroflexota bacterium]